MLNLKFMNLLSHYCLIIFFITIGCYEKPVDYATIEQSGFVLIFESIPENSRYVFPNGIITNNGDFEIQYIDDNLLPHFISPNADSSSDTIKIISKRELIEIQHAYRGVDKLSILLINGDTALFRYVEKRPYVTILSRQTNSGDSNYEMIMRDNICDGDFPARIKYQYPFAFIRIDSTQSDLVFNRTHEEFRSKAFDEIEREGQLLDSLEESKKISPSVVDFFRIQNRFDSIDVIQLHDLDIKKYLAKDDYLFYAFYNDFLNRILFDHYGSKAQKIKSGNSIVPDFESIYDVVKESDGYSEATKRILLRKALEQIIQNSDVESIKKYCVDFAQIAEDSLSLDYLTNKFGLNFDTSDQLNLLKVDGANTSFDNLLKAHSGDIIYIDFWASWCAPCIAQFPSSKLLKEKFKNRKVTFIYLSIDSDSVKWKKASTKFNLENSFLVKNRFSSFLQKDLKVTSIPRYLLYGKTGIILHSNAPRPGDKSIVALIEKEL